MTAIDQLFKIHPPPFCVGKCNADCVVVRDAKGQIVFLDDSCMPDELKPYQVNQFTQSRMAVGRALVEISTPRGEIHPPKSLILRQSVGTAKMGKYKYEMSTSMHGEPVVKSEKTGKWFSLSWENILEMAIEKGIDR